MILCDFCAGQSVQTCVLYDNFCSFIVIKVSKGAGILANTYLTDMTNTLSIHKAIYTQYIYISIHKPLANHMMKSKSHNSNHFNAHKRDLSSGISWKLLQKTIVIRLRG